VQYSSSSSGGFGVARCSVGWDVVKWCNSLAFLFQRSRKAQLLSSKSGLRNPRPPKLWLCKLGQSSIWALRCSIRPIWSRNKLEPRCSSWSSIRSRVVLRCLGGVARGRVIIRGIGVVARGSVSYGIILRCLSGVVLGGLGVVTGR
jgi:hypothetical protein